jgi:SAM-dependent methyltransferase
MKVIRKSKQFAGRLFSILKPKEFFNRSDIGRSPETIKDDFRLAKLRLLSSGTLSANEKTLLNRVSLRVHYSDGMYVTFEALHYLSVGLSAIRCIEGALQKSPGHNAVRCILDFPSGYGRVLRYLRAQFPDAAITVAEIDRRALEFCTRAFSAKSVVSDTDFKLSLAERFDLIWCGSLVTHIREKATADLLKFFYEHLLPGGLCVFTTHGQLSAEWIEKNKETYGLSEDARRKVLSQFHDTGYGYADYGQEQECGVSVASHDRILAIARGVGHWNETFYLEHGWDNHQDVYGLAKGLDRVPTLVLPGVVLPPDQAS